MVTLRHIALVSEAANVDASDLTRVSAALQKQVARDFTPIWEVAATVDPFVKLEDVPAGYWPIIVTLADIGDGLDGVHSDEQGQPVARVEWSESWSLTASHECLEMLADPWGNQLKTSRQLDDPDARAEYLVEICDPCQDAKFAYAVNDILVSDFYTPEFFDREGSSRARYSQTGAIEKPLQVLEGGYLSFRKPGTNNWFQVDGTGKQTDLGVIQLGAGNLRGFIDRNTPAHLANTRIAKDTLIARTGKRRAVAKEASKMRAARLRTQLKGSKTP